MYQIIHISPAIGIGSHTLSYIAGFFAWMFLTFFIIKRINFFDLLFECLVIFVLVKIGSRLFFVVLNINEYLSGKVKFYFFDAGQSGHGAIIGAFLSLLLLSKFQKISFLNKADSMVIPVPLVCAIIRIGCFLAGCCRGTQTDFFLGVAFPDEMSPLIFRHPVQLYDSLLNLYLFFFLFEMKDKKRYDGHLSLLFLFWYSVIRFFMEYYRWGVSAKVMFGFITQAQLASLVIIAVSLYFMRKLSAQVLNERVVSV